MIQSYRKIFALFFLTTVFAAGPSGQTTGDAPHADPLIGIWASVTRFNNSSPRELVISRERSTWRARIADRESTVDGQTPMRFEIPGQGSFRGSLGGKVINGIWAEMPGTLPGLVNPYDQVYTSPVVLKRSGKDRWKGTVRPLEQRITVYLKVFQAADGTLQAVFRNPEANMVGEAMQYRVSRDGESVVFSAGPDPSKPTATFTGSLLTSPERLRVSWRDLDGNIDLERRTPAEAAAFFPRPPGSPKYVYQKPQSTGDGWRTARARDVGMDEAALARAVQQIIDIDPAGRRPWMIHSIAVAYKGKLVLDEYFFDHRREEPHDTRSAAKMFSSLILGTLMKDGIDISPTTKIYDVMAPLGPFANPDPRKKDITLEHLMSHSAGLACDDISGTSPGDERKVQADRTKLDWTKVTLDLPMEYEAGQALRLLLDEHQPGRGSIESEDRRMASCDIRQTGSAAAAVWTLSLELAGQWRRIPWGRSLGTHTRLPEDRSSVS